MLRGTVRLVLALIVNVAMMLAYALSLGPMRRFRRPVQVLWCRMLCGIAGLQVRPSGTIRPGGGTLFVANHVSYLDIPVLARYVGAAFVAKAEVGRWPLFGWAARLTGTIFVQRVGTEARAQGRVMLDRLARGENLILFAEGTSTDGANVAAFKSTLFGIAEQAPAQGGVAVQPVSITYSRALDGTPLVGDLRALYCWFGDATLVPHLLRMLSLPGAEVDLRFHQPISPGGMTRKELARRAQAAVATGVAAANASLVTPEDAGGGVSIVETASVRDAVAPETERSAPIFQ